MWNGVTSSFCIFDIPHVLTPTALQNRHFKVINLFFEECDLKWSNPNPNPPLSKRFFNNSKFDSKQLHGNFSFPKI